MLPDSFSILRDRAGTADPVRLRVCGDVDLYTAPKLRAALGVEKRADHAVRLDLSEVLFIDSMGLQVIVKALTEAAADGWQLQVGPASDSVRMLLHRTGLADILSDEPSQR